MGCKIGRSDRLCHGRVIQGHDASSLGASQVGDHSPRPFDRLKSGNALGVKLRECIGQ